MAGAKDVLAKLQKDMGTGIGHQGSKQGMVPRLPTGVFQFDLATGGGLPRGRVTNIYGTESSTKTSLATLAMKSSQAEGKKAVIVALEPFDPDWTVKLGCSLDNLYVIVPDTAEQAVDACVAMVEAEDVGIVVVDSIAQLTTQNEIESSAEKVIVGGASLMTGKLIRKSSVALNTRNKQTPGDGPCLVFLNQIRHKIGVMFGDPETQPGGNALNFVASLKVRLYGKNGPIEKGEDLPKFRHVSGIIKKWKVPIVASTFEYDFILKPHDGLSIGQTDSWNTVASYLKSYGLLVNNGKGWTCCGAEFKTLAEIGERYATDQDARAALQIEVVKRAFASPMDAQK